MNSLLKLLGPVAIISTLSFCVDLEDSDTKDDNTSELSSSSETVSSSEEQNHSSSEVIISSSSIDNNAISSLAGVEANYKILKEHKLTSQFSHGVRMIEDVNRVRELIGDDTYEIPDDRLIFQLSWYHHDYSVDGEYYLPRVIDNKIYMGVFLVPDGSDKTLFLETGGSIILELEDKGMEILIYYDKSQTKADSYSSYVQTLSSESYSSSESSSSSVELESSSSGDGEKKHLEYKVLRESEFGFGQYYVDETVIFLDDLDSIRTLIDDSTYVIPDGRQVVLILWIGYDTGYTGGFYFPYILNNEIYLGSYSREGDPNLGAGDAIVGEHVIIEMDAIKLKMNIINEQLKFSRTIPDGYCLKESDCDDEHIGMSCFGPDENNCGILRDPMELPPDECEKDEDCDLGNKCETMIGMKECFEDNYTKCTPTCALIDCAPGYDCMDDQCVISCIKDEDCGDTEYCGEKNYCIEFGRCEYPVP